MSKGIDRECGTNVIAQDDKEQASTSGVKTFAPMPADALNQSPHGLRMDQQFGSSSR